MRTKATTIWTAIVLVALVFGCATGPIYRPGREHRTINAAEYEVAIQKSGRVDVILRSGQVVLANAQPMVWYAGDRAPRALPIMGERTMRQQVNDRLGQGQGIVYGHRQCEWAIRVYPDKPFFTVQVAYTNTGRRPVKIQALSPFYLGRANRGAVSLGADPVSAVFLQNPSPFPGPPQPPAITSGAGEGLWYLAGFNPASRQTLVAGFLTSDTGYGALRMEQTDNAPPGLYDHFEAMCYFDPPVEVPPGGRVESEVFYISVAERNPLEGLERYGHAVAAVNEVPIRKPPLPHGSTALAGKQLSEQAVLAEMDAMEQDLARYGWDTIAIGDGWQRAPGVWEPDEAAFPRGFAPLVRDMHSRGMRASLHVNPFIVPNGSPLATEHSEWLVPPAEWAVPALPEGARILDVTRPEADAYVRQLFEKISRTWGFDTVEGLNVPYGVLAAEHYSDPSLTRLDVLRIAMSAVDAGMGPGKAIVCAGPQPVLRVRGDAMDLGQAVAPLWRGDARDWGSIDALDATALRYFFSPYLYAPSSPPAYFDTPGLPARWPELDVHTFTKEQTTACLTAMALKGGVLKVGNTFAELTSEQRDILTKLLPAVHWRARPLDLFDNNPPRLWSARLRTGAGEWFYAAVFNWSLEEEPPATLYLGEIGMSPENVYTVYDFWADRFFGLAQGQLNVQAPPGGVRLLGFRQRRNHPILVASTRHFTQGALETTSLEWDAERRELRGEANVIPDTDYGLRIFVPNAYSVSEAAVSGAQPTLVTRGDILEVNFHNQAADKVRWYVRF